MVVKVHVKLIRGWILELEPVKNEHCAGVIKTEQPDSEIMKPKERNCLINKCDRFAIEPVCGIEYRQFGSACEMEKMGCLENKG